MALTKADRFTIAALTDRRDAVITDLQMKVAYEDWHGVADAAMDLREIDIAIDCVHSLAVTKPPNVPGT